MELFDHNGHLTDGALKALIENQELPELSRLEISEHLSYCDECLMRYTDLLTGDVLITPENSCEKTIWQKIRMRVFRVLTSRYATAAAAIAIVFSLWGGGVFADVVSAAEAARQNQSSFSESIRQHHDKFSEATSDFFNSISGMFDHTANNNFKLNNH